MNPFGRLVNMEELNKRSEVQHRKQEDIIYLGPGVSGLLGDRRARATGTGERDALHARVGDPTTEEGKRRFELKREHVHRRGCGLVQCRDPAVFLQ